METLAFDIIICWKWFGMKKTNKYFDFNGTLKLNIRDEKWNCQGCVQD